MTQFLASVRDLGEAQVAVACGADIIDLKAPDRGSLGALPTEQIKQIVTALRGAKPISATVGDLPMEPAPVRAAVAAAVAAGVDFVKVGLFPGGNGPQTVRELQHFTRRGVHLVAVFFADQDPWIIAPADLWYAGFVGCMLDTLDKKRGSLTAVSPPSFLQNFVGSVRDTGMFCGLAGSLALDDIPVLNPLEPDYLGFRGALCRRHCRTDQLDGERVQRIAAALRTAASCPSSAPTGEPATPGRELPSRKLWGIG